MSKLLDYINHLDKDASARAEHQTAPVKSMTNFGLTVDEQDALLVGDRQRIAGAIGILTKDLPMMIYIAPGVK
ncbi:MAG: hypothetical protein JO269_10790 [Burkholderiaceae bacterium]|nr:hypothetical protein [Burkholderiaceae bacterium]